MTCSALTRRDAGFTLLETLVALALVALLVGSVLQALRWVGGASGFGQRAERAAAVQAGAQAWSDMLAGALPAAPGAASFRGDASTFSFDGVSDGTAMPPGRVRIAIGHQRNGTGGAIVVTARPDGAPDGAGAGWTTVLLEGVTQASFSYFGSADGVSAPAWTSSWTSTTVAPRLVLADLSLEGLPTAPRLPLYARVGRFAPSSAPR